MSDNSVTVSDRMRDFVDALDRANDDYLLHGGKVEDHTAAYNALVREIGWLETVVDQRGKRIRELEARAITNPRDVSNSLGEPCPPQTRREAMPEHVTRFVEQARRLVGDNPLELRADAMLWLADDRSRLLTALDEKEKQHAEEREAWTLDYLALAKYRDELQSASVLQKEALEQKDKELEGEQWQCRRVADFLEIANRRHHELQQEVQRLTLANLSLLESAVLQKEELDEFKRADEDRAYEERTRD